MIGLDRFREFFQGHENKFAVIGGTACHLHFESLGATFRATKDVDMVICVEMLDAEFATRFLRFIETGGYQARERGDRRREFYRFHKPQDPSFPDMLELFARPGASLDLAESATYVRLDVENDIASLSAILLNDAYYKALLSGRVEVAGIPVLSPELLIPFKARAFIDLDDRRRRGEAVSTNEIRKHARDVFRLLQILAGDASVPLDDEISADLSRFITVIESDEDFRPKDFDVPETRESGCASLRQIYGMQ